MTSRITTRNARFQQWQALLDNRTKRHRSGEFVVQGVRPISLAVEHGWTVRALVGDDQRRRSAWAERLWDSSEPALAGADRVLMAAALLAELGERDDPPELVAVVAQPTDDLDRIDAGALVVVLDRPSYPGNIGTLARSADAFGASALVVTGHAADPYDPRSVRASTGSLFALTVVRSPSHREVLGWARTTGRRVLGLDESGTVDVRDATLTGPLAVVVGNETTGLTAGWRDGCDELLSIPMAGSASSLNAATAGSIVLHEALRQRRTATS
ncbi:MAG: TrmH family RNA methyltransferase [Nocardioides sp.]